MFYNQTQLEALKKFFSDPEWHLVEELLLDYIEPLRDIRNVDLKDSATGVKGEIRVRIHTYELLDKFIQDCRTIGTSTITNNPNSME